MVEDTKQAIDIGIIAIFILTMICFGVGDFFNKKTLIIQKFNQLVKRLIKEIEDNDNIRELNDGGWKVTEIEDNYERMEKEKKGLGFDKNTRRICNEDLEEAKRKHTEQICSNLLKIARETKSKEKAENEEVQKKATKILEIDSLLPDFIKTLWKNKAFFGKKYISDSGKMYYGIRSLEFQKDKKRIIFKIDSFNGDYSTIRQVLISVLLSDGKSFSYKRIEKLTPEEFEETEKLLEEINADWIVKNCS